MAMYGNPAGSSSRRAHRAAVVISVYFIAAAAALPCLAQSATATTAKHDTAQRRILVSLQNARLWLVEGTDTLLSAPVAVGRFASFTWQGRTFDWRTPVGVRTVLDKRVDPLWTVPQWHYYERASNEQLRVVEIEAGRRYPLADGSHLEVRDRNVVRVLDGRYWKVPQNHEIVMDGVIYVPPAHTMQRRVSGALGTRALDLGDGYLIHGTHAGNRSSIGSAASHGCIRMRNEDVERLFDLVGVGTTVEIF